MRKDLIRVKGMTERGRMPNEGASMERAEERRIPKERETKEKIPKEGAPSGKIST